MPVPIEVIMKYILRNSITGFLLSLTVAYFIRLWAMDHGHKLLSTLATIYMFILLFPLIVAMAVVALVLLVIFFTLILTGKRLFKGWKPFWYKNKTWTR